MVNNIPPPNRFSNRQQQGQFNQAGPGGEQQGEFGPQGGGQNQDGYNFYPNSQQGPPQQGQQAGQYSGPFPHPPYPNHTVNPGHPGYNRVPTDTVSSFVVLIIFVHVKFYHPCSASGFEMHYKLLIFCFKNN